MLVILLVLVSSGLTALTSFGTSAPVLIDTVDPSISILSPNGGEAWYIGDTNNILWIATDDNLIGNPVYLWYSLNNGADYLPIASGTANDGTEAWLMPDTESYNAKVRIRVADSFGNTTLANSASTFSITYVPPLPPVGMTINTANGEDAVISWQPVTQTIYNTPFTPDGYIVLYNETPYEDDRYYYFLSSTATISYTHHSVAHFRQQMFYRVVAYKDYRGTLSNILASAKANPEQQLSFAEIKIRLHESYGGDK